MARKTLSSQIIEETDRCRGLLASVQDSSSDILGILIGTAIESLNRIEGLCLSAMQSTVTAALQGNPLATVEKAEETRPASTRRPATHKAPSRRKAGS